MSELHKWKKRHEKMTKEQKEKCSCDMCKGTNIYRRFVIGGRKTFREG